MADELLHGGFIISFMKFIIILILIMTDLSASNDVIIIIIIIHHHIFKNTLRNQTQIFLILKTHSLISLQVIIFCYTAKYST